MQELARSALPDSYAPDIVLAIHPLVLCIAWFAVNQSVGVSLHSSESAWTHSIFTQALCLCGLLSCRLRRQRDVNVHRVFTKGPIYLASPLSRDLPKEFPMFWIA